MSLLIKSKSEHDLTGRNRERGTLMPWAFRKCLMAAPAAVSSWQRVEHMSLLTITITAAKTHLDNWVPIFGDFGIHNDVKLHATIIHDPLQSCTQSINTVRRVWVASYLWGQSKDCSYWKPWMLALERSPVLQYKANGRENDKYWPDLKSSAWSLGTWAISRSWTDPL